MKKKTYLFALMAMALTLGSCLTTRTVSEARPPSTSPFQPVSAI